MTGTSGLVQSGTKTFIVGTVSGIDTSALVELGVQQRTRKADLIDVNISTNNAKVAAYSELQTLSAAVQSALSDLRNQTTVNTVGSNSFDSRAGFVSTSDGSNPAGVLDIAVDNGAPLGTYNIEIIQQAKAHKVIGASVADKDAALGHLGSFNIGVAGGTTAQIDITAGQSLADIAAAINLEESTTGVSATVIKISETEFQLSLTASDTAVAIETSVVSGVDVMNLIGVSDGVGGFNNVLQAELSAIIELDGVTVTRDDNNFDDLITGITLDINNESPGTIYTLRVENDAEAIKTAINEFITAYNALRDFVIAQNTVSADGLVSESSILFSDVLMDGLDLAASTLITNSAGTSALITSLKDIGIDLDGNNKLFIGSATELDDAIIDNFDLVKGLFASEVTSDDTQFGLLKNESTQGNLNFALDITINGGGNITSVGVGGDTSLFVVNGALISGAKGSIYEGLQFAYSGTTTTTVNVVVSQGLADRLSNTLNAYSKTSDGGLFQDEKTRLENVNTTLSAESLRIREIAEKFREKEIARYAAMEAALQRNELLVRQIRALFGLNDDDN